LVTEGTAAYQQAVAYNTAGRKAMMKWLNEAAAQTSDKILRNSAQWCLSGKTKLYCQTKTHDSAARVRAAGQPRRFVAIFGYPQGAITEGQVSYLRKLRGETAFDNTNVAIEAPSGGSAPAGAITVVDPVPSGKRAFFDTIRHEVQHSADHHPATDEGLFKTELNARWLEKSYAGYSPRRRVRRQGYTWNERQYAVFQNLLQNKDLYPYMRRNWNSSNRAERDAWRAMVVAYTKPDSFNPINSIRIENLNDALWNVWGADCREDEKFRAGTGPENPKASAVRAAIAAMDELDKQALRQNAELKARGRVHLEGKLLDEFNALIAGP
jgi:hypothetical protein